MFMFVQNDRYSILGSWCSDCFSFYSNNSMVLLFIKVPKKIKFSYENAVFVGHTGMVFNTTILKTQKPGNFTKPGKPKVGNIYKMMQRYTLDFSRKIRSVTVPTFGFFSSTSNQDLILSVGTLYLTDTVYFTTYSFRLKTIKSLFGYCAYKTYQTNGEWLQTKIDFISQKIKPVLKLK